MFDLDGVLVDSTAAVARVWRLWAQRHGLPEELVIREAHGRRSIETIRALAPRLDAESENEIVESMEVSDLEGVVALPGAIGLLRSLPATRFAIVTSATRALATARLKHACLPIPELLISADDVGEGKPSPKPYLQGAKLLESRAHECLVFEDTTAGIESGHKAGMRVIALTTTFPAQELASADAIIDSLDRIQVRISESAIHIDVDRKRNRCSAET